MQYLTPQDLRKIAPATQKMPQSDENLVSTKAFLRKVEKMGFNPIFAAQGTAHADADQPLKSRHLVVAANSTGLAVALLNSHSIWRRAWIGLGVAKDDQFMIGASVPLPRWKGFDGALDAVFEHTALLGDASAALRNWKPEDHQHRWLAKQFAARAWLKGHKQPLPKAFFDAIQNEAAEDAVLIMLAMARKAGLLSAPTDSYMPPRKLKPIIAPDAAFHAADQAFQKSASPGCASTSSGTFRFPPTRTAGNARTHRSGLRGPELQGYVEPIRHVG